MVFLSCCSSPVMCGEDYFRRTSADHPTALEMMREASIRLAPMFAEWDDPKLLTDSIQKLLDNSSPIERSSKVASYAFEGENRQTISEIDLCSTQASSRRDSARTSLASSSSSASTRVYAKSSLSSSLLGSLSSYDAAEQYILDCLEINNYEENKLHQCLAYENCAILFQLTPRPGLTEVTS